MDMTLAQLLSILVLMQSNLDSGFYEDFWEE